MLCEEVANVPSSVSLSKELPNETMCLGTAVKGFAKISRYNFKYKLMLL
jgi:hypothetical protein